MFSRLFLLTVLALVPVTWAKNIEPMSFRHENWQVVCSNTGTCQAAGYGQDVDESASILLQRAAGKNSAVTARWVLGNYDGHLDKVLSSNSPIYFYVHGKNMGQVKMTNPKGNGDGFLNTAQKNAVLAAAKQDGVFEFKKGGTTWTVLGKGMAAVLLKMDAFQQRVGTVGALLQQGGKDESQVLQPQAPMVIKKVATDEKPYLILKPDDKDYASLKRKLLAAIPSEEECLGVSEGWGADSQWQDIVLYRLGNQKSLATTLCWRGAYNAGEGAWVIDALPTSKNSTVQWVTNMATDISSGQIHASHKDRGLGDCWSANEWTWDGKQFIHSQDMTTGQCTLIAAGGPWQLDLIEAKIIKE